VRPAEPVTDFRTAVTGRTAADLQAVDYSREEAQRDVLSLLQGVPAACCRGIGHMPYALPAAGATRGYVHDLGMTLARLHHRLGVMHLP
jgi:hypothetical protein